MTDTYHQNKFEELVKTRMKNPQCTKSKIEKLIEMLENGPITKRDERTSQNFHVIELNDVKELRYIDPYWKGTANRSLIIFPLENVFDKIFWCWKQVGYAGCKALQAKIREQGYFINFELVKLFLSHSPKHQSRLMKKTQKTLVTNPILSNEFGARGQVDLIYMRTNPDGEYNWILNYQDHFTKWLVLRPLKKRCAEEVSNVLTSIFYMLGAPNYYRVTTEKNLTIIYCYLL